MNKIIIVLGLILGFFVFGLCGYLSYKNNALSQEVANLAQDLANAHTLIDVQNAQIQQNALSLEQYKRNLDTSNAKIFTKYKNVYLTDEGCQKQLESIKELIKAFYE